MNFQSATSHSISISSRLTMIRDCKLVLLVSKIKYPKYPSYYFPIYVLLKYIKMFKSKRTFRLKSAPEELFYKLSKHLVLDANNCILINGGYLRAILNSPEFVKLKCDGKERLVQAIEATQLGEESVVITDTLRYNLDNVNFGNNARISPIELESVKVASVVEVSMVALQHMVAVAVTDLLLKNYFRNPKILYKNDILAIDVKNHAPEFFYTNIEVNEIKFIHFKVNRIVIDGDQDCRGGCFCIRGATTLKQTREVQSFLPKMRQLVLNAKTGADFEDYFLDLCPFGLESYFVQLEKSVKPFIAHRNLKLNPTFLLQGSKGCGKRALISALVKKTGFKLCKLSTNDLSTQAYAKTEIKMRNAFFRAKICSPCIVAIYNFENFCKNNEGQYDSRIINHFKIELDILFANNNHPVILLCVSNSKDLPSELSRIFLESITIDAPNQNDRSKILSWISKRNCLMNSAHLDGVAGKTHGFLFEDLEALVYYAHKSMLDRDGGNVSDEDYETAIDIMQSNYTESLGAPKVPKVLWSDVGGLDDVKQEIIKTINLPLKRPELLKTSGLKRMGLLLYGPPGTGKTLIAKAVATECGLCFLSVKGPELLNMYVGQSEQNVREVFEKARQASPCIIFFDELDSLAPNRGISGDSGGVMDQVVSQLLSEMDGLNQSATIFVIGATNRPDLIDPALLRPGRFDKLLYVGPCTDLSSKVSVLKALTRKFKLSEKINMEQVIKSCPDNITGADFYGICANAWMSAARRLVKKIQTGKLSVTDVNEKSVLVTFKDFEQAIRTVKPSISQEDLVYFERLRMELSAKN